MYYLYKAIVNHYQAAVSRELNLHGHTNRMYTLNQKRIYWLGKMFSSAGRVYVRG